MPSPAPPSVTCETVHVNLGARAYDILIGAGLLDQAGARLAPLLARPYTAIVTDETVARLHLAPLVDSLNKAGIRSDVITVPAGESAKSFARLESLVEDLLRLGVERSDTVTALGGGVIGDLTGFAAAVLRRGTHFIQIPTTLLAQVDSSVGGKTGINTAQGKNLVGAFHQPRLVLTDIAVLDTLPEREFRAGYAEVVKYALISDAAFFEWLETHAGALQAGDPSSRISAIRTACQAKARIVADDEREAGRRALLNLGHTFGHAFEAALGYGGAVRHGEAVAVGLCWAFALSHELGLCPAEDVTRVRRHIAAAGLPTTAADLGLRPEDSAAVINHMAQDKKVVGGALTLILAKGIGHAFITRDVSQDTVGSFVARALSQAGPQQKQ